MDIISRRAFIKLGSALVAALGLGIRPNENSVEDHSILDEVNSWDDFLPPGKVYYVDDYNGNNRNDGLTYATAWKSLGRAKLSVRPGDLVYCTSQGRAASYARLLKRTDVTTEDIGAWFKGAS